MLHIFMLHITSEILAVPWHIYPKTKSTTRLTKLSIPKPVQHILYKTILRNSSRIFIGHSIFNLLLHSIENDVFLNVWYKRLQYGNPGISEQAEMEALQQQ